LTKSPLALVREKGLASQNQTKITLRANYGCRSSNLVWIFLNMKTVDVGVLFA